MVLVLVLLHFSDLPVFFQYLFVDKRNNMIYSTRDDCLTFENSTVSFMADELSFHSTSSDVVVAYDETAKKVCLGVIMMDF